MSACRMTGDLLDHLPGGHFGSWKWLRMVC